MHGKHLHFAMWMQTEISPPCVILQPVWSTLKDFALSTEYQEYCVSHACLYVMNIRRYFSSQVRIYFVPGVHVGLYHILLAQSLGEQEEWGSCTCGGTTGVIIFILYGTSRNTLSYFNVM